LKLGQYAVGCDCVAMKLTAFSATVQIKKESGSRVAERCRFPSYFCLEHTIIAFIIASSWKIRFLSDLETSSHFCLATEIEDIIVKTKVCRIKIEVARRDSKFLDLI